MTLINKYSAIDKAITVSTGNTLVICGDTTTKSQNTSSMLKPDGTYTRNWMENGSSSNLNIINNSDVLYSELIWYSTVKSNIQSATDVRSIADSPITFITPKGENLVSPEVTENYEGTSGTINRFRSANVTNIIKSSLSGTYTVSKVPTSLPSSGLSNTNAGWALLVVYRNPLFRPRRITVSTGIGVAKENAPLQTSLVGFKTPGEEMSLTGNITLICSNAEPLTGLQTVKAGPSFASLSILGNTVGTPNPNPGTSPNNSRNAFFAGQINVCDPLSPNVGLLNISGTNGTKNHDGFVPFQTFEGRNKWDMTTVSLDNTLVPNQNILSGELNATETEDGVQLLALSGSVSAYAPDITAALSYEKENLTDDSTREVSERVTYFVKIKNTGFSSAKDLIFKCPLNAACSFIPNSVLVNGEKSIGANIVSGVNLGTIAPYSVINLSFDVRINSIPAGGVLSTSLDYNYSFDDGSSYITYTNYAKTNTTNITVYHGNLEIVKSASSNFVSINSNIDYTVSIKNTGTENALNLFFQDKISKYCSFVSESLKINGTSKPELDPIVGFNLPNMLIGDEIIVTFSVTVNSLPPSTIVENGALVTYTFEYDEYDVPVRKTLTSNTISIAVKYSEIVASRTCDNFYPNPLDIVTCTLKLTNIGNISRNNIAVLEPPIEGTEFVNGSVTIDGVSKPNLNPYEGFEILTLSKNQTALITYKIKIISISPKQLIENIATVPFKYQIDTTEGDISSQKDSNKVVTRSNFVDISITETVDKAYAELEDLLYYTVSLTNNGNIDALNTIFNSNIQLESTFVQGSVKINGVPMPNLNLNAGFSIGALSPLNTTVVTFILKASQIPSPNIIYNSSSLIYDYYPDPNANHITDTVISNRVQTIIDKFNLTITKSTSKNYVQLGESYIYKTEIENTGTVIAKNVFFYDKLPYGLDFYEASVYIDGTLYADYNPEIGFSLPDIHPNDKISVYFVVTPIIAPDSSYVVNSSKVNYSYKLNDDSPDISDEMQSNEVTTKIITGTLSIQKTVDKSYATINDELLYSFFISNTGNVKLSNINFFDAMPTGSEFISGSVYINEINKSSFNPNLGFNLGSLNASETINLTFKAKVKSVPNPNTLINTAHASFSYYVDPTDELIVKNITSNTVTTVVNVGTVSLTKSVDKSYATLNDELTYTILAQNTGTVEISSITLKDTLQADLEFVPGSVFIDDINYPQLNPNTGFNLSNIQSLGNTQIKFNAKVKNLISPYLALNSATINYKYYINPFNAPIYDSKTSNTVTTNINYSSITINKTVNKSYATLTDTLTYTSLIKNDGNIPAENTLFKDVIASNAAFVLGSVKIDDVTMSSFNPNTGFTLDTIAPKQTVKVTFDVTVSTLPTTWILNNISELYYKYKIDEDSSIYFENTVYSNKVSTNIVAPSVTIAKTANRLYARIGDIIDYNFVITNTGNADLTNTTFTDLIQSNSSFVAGSVYVNGVNNSNLNPNNGFTLNTISYGHVINLKFSVRVDTIPSNGKLYNTGSLNYSYYIDPNSSIITKTATSNQTTVNINDTIISATKSCDKEIAKIGDTLTFSVNIKNAGNSPAENIVFTDSLDSNIQFIDSSVYVNSVNKPLFNPNDGFNLANILGLGETIVQFKAKVISKPLNNIVKNFATINYEYKVNPSDPYTQVTLQSNTVSIFIATGKLSVTKYVDLAYATLNDLLTYTVTVKNTGSVNATNIRFIDLLDSALTFQTGTVSINGIVNLSSNPETGFNLPTLAPNETATVSFAAIVNSIPSLGKVDNKSTVTFDFKLTPEDNISTSTIDSNTVTTLIKLGNLNLTKSVDLLYATIDDEINYTITVTNTGNATCTNIVLKDLIQSDAQFILGSVKINDVWKENFDPNVGFAINDLGKDESASIKFKVKVKSLPITHELLNTSSASYKYFINPNNSPIIKDSTSNTVTTHINVSSITVSKNVNYSYATINDILVYSITVSNTGTVPVTSVNFRDVLPNGLRFISDSVYVDNINIKGYNPYSSFTLGTIASGDSVTVRFNAEVTSVPTPSLISNTANIVYSYKIDPNGQVIVKEKTSNAATTKINKGSVTITKSVDKEYATLLDTLEYSLVITNDGNVDVTDLIFNDTIQTEASFVTGSVKINGILNPDLDPQVGFNLGTLQTLNSITVSFKVKINSMPQTSSIYNYGFATFSYKIDPSDQNYTKTVTSNPVITILYVGNMSITKEVDLDYATILDVIKYKVTVKNTGNAALYDLFFIDSLSDGGSFNPGTVKIDGVLDASLNPINGFNLPTLIEGNTATVEFTITVNKVPTPSQITNYASVNGYFKIDPYGNDIPISKNSNTVSTQINACNITNVKSVDKLYAKIDDILTYTVTLTNAGNITASNVYFFDLLQSDLIFVPGSVRINDVINPSLDPNPGFKLNDFAPMQVVTVSFDAKVKSLPTPPQVDNKSQVEFSFKINPNNPVITKTNFSNTVTTRISKGELTQVKSVNKTIATINDILIFTISITNTGNSIAKEVFFQDIIAEGATFVTDSVKIDNVSKPSVDPNVGFIIEDIGIGDVKIVQFSAKVTSVPPTNKVLNQAVINFKYSYDPKQADASKTSYSNTTTTNIALGNLTVTKSVDKEYATIGQYLTYTVIVTNTGNIDATNVVFLDPTPRNASFILGSITVNGTSYPSYNPAVGFPLSTMKPGQIITVVYNVKVIS